MQAVIVSGMLGIGAVVGVAACAFWLEGLGVAVCLLLVGTMVVIEAARQADRYFVAPLQRYCQEAFNRQIAALF